MKDKKKIVIIVCITLILCVACICFLVFKQKEKENLGKNNENVVELKPLLYEVSWNGNDNKIYLFGSIHFADENAYPLPDEVMSAYDESDYLAVEFDTAAYENDTELVMETAMMMLLDDGQTVDKVMMSDTYNLMINYIDENGGYNSLYDYYTPVFHYSLISSILSEKADINSKEGIDAYFLDEAYVDGKEILEVESALEQYQLLVSFPNDLYDLMIKYSIMYEDDLVEDTRLLYEAWLAGDEEKLAIYTDETNEEELESFEEYDNVLELIEAYEKKLIDDRNVAMAETAESYLLDGKDVFIVVGAGHIVGEDGIVDLLTEMGYKVEKVQY